MAPNGSEETKYRKTLAQIIKEHREKADAQAMNSSQRLELARLHSSAEFGSAVIELWPEIRSAISLPSDRSIDLKNLEYLYEVAK